MDGGHRDLFELLVLLAGSFLMPVISQRVRLPSAVLLIAFGLAMGPAGVSMLHDGRVIGFLYELGFIVLMFLAGMEIDFTEIRRRGGAALALGVGVCAAVVGLAFLAAAALGFPPLFGLALGAMSVGLPLAVLKETGALRSTVGQTVILLGSIGEFFTLVGMTLLYLSSVYGLSFELVAGLSRLVVVLMVAGMTLRVLLAAAWWNPDAFARLVEGHDSSEIGVRAALLTMMAFSLLAVAAGVESIIGSFLAGALIAFVLRGKEALEHKVGVVGHGLFVPLFFIVVGLRFDPALITGDSLLVAGELLVVSFLVRLIPSVALMRQGLTRREVLGTAALLASPLTLLVAIAALGVETSALQASETGTLIVLAVLTGAVFPVLYRAVVPGRA